MSNFTVEFLSAGVSACAAPTIDHHHPTIHTLALQPLCVFFFYSCLLQLLLLRVMAIFSLFARGVAGEQHGLERDDGARRRRPERCERLLQRRR